MTNVNDLPDTVQGGDPGHTSAHQTIHQVLKIIKGQVDTMLALLNGVGQNGIINDNVTGTDSTYSSQFIATSLGNMNSYLDSRADENDKKINDLDKFLILDSERGVWVDAMNGTTVDPQPKSGGLQEVTYSSYMASTMNTPRCTETKKVISGAVSVGHSPEKDGFIRTPSSDPGSGVSGMNSAYVYAVTLDAPSTSGPVVFRMISESSGGEGNTFTENITIPEGETFVLITDDLYKFNIVGNSGVADVIESGTGASGLSVQVVRR